jgi:hypothetical protein
MLDQAVSCRDQFKSELIADFKAGVNCGCMIDISQRLSAVFLSICADRLVLFKLTLKLQ